MASSWVSIKDACRPCPSGLVLGLLPSLCVLECFILPTCPHPDLLLLFQVSGFQNELFSVTGRLSGEIIQTGRMSYLHLRQVLLFSSVWPRTHAHPCSGSRCSSLRWMREPGFRCRIRRMAWHGKTAGSDSQINTPPLKRYSLNYPPKPGQETEITSVSLSGNVERRRREGQGERDSPTQLCHIGLDVAG